MAEKERTTNRRFWATSEFAWNWEYKSVPSTSEMTNSGITKESFNRKKKIFFNQGGREASTNEWHNDEKGHIADDVGKAETQDCPS